MNQNTHIAVIDVGKTNKKLFIFNEQLQLVDSVYRSFDETIADGIRYEAIEEMTEWYRQELRRFAGLYTIKAICPTTHGATVVALDKSGKIALPQVAYTTEADETFRQAFYQHFGNREELQRTTATAEIGSLVNIAKLLYFNQLRFPEAFENINVILGFPQYFGHFLTGKCGAEPTYIGCHSYLFDPSTKNYSAVARKLGILEKLPARISPSWEILGHVSTGAATQTGLSTECIVAMGIHDSNSSLLPYLVKGHHNFVLNSTGTWCVAMHPTNTVTFAENELGKLVFYNFDPFFNPVKTSIFMGGLEFDTYLKLLQKINNRTDHPHFDAGNYQRIITEKNLFILPSVVKGTGIFPQSLPCAMEHDRRIPLQEIEKGATIPQFFRDYETAYAVLNLSLVAQTNISLRMAGFDSTGSIFTEGGFRKNTGYNAILAAAFPQGTTCTTQMPEATAFGAALCAKAALTGKSPLDFKEYFEIETNSVEVPVIMGLKEYLDEFSARVTA